MVETNIQVRDFTTLAEPSDTVVGVYFEELAGSVHVYRDGTVVLSSAIGTTVTRLQQPRDRLWRQETFLSILAQMGASDQELVAAGFMVEAREKALSQLGFQAAVQQAAAKSVAHFQDWCTRHDLDHQAMSEEQIDEWLTAQLAEVRRAA